MLVDGDTAHKDRALDMYNIFTMDCRYRCMQIACVHLHVTFTRRE